MKNAGGVSSMGSQNCLCHMSHVVFSSSYSTTSHCTAFRPTPQVRPHGPKYSVHRPHAAALLPARQQRHPSVGCALTAPRMPELCGSTKLCPPKFKLEANTQLVIHGVLDHSARKGPLEGEGAQLEAAVYRPPFHGRTAFGYEATCCNDDSSQASGDPTAHHRPSRRDARATQVCSCMTQAALWPTLRPSNPHITWHQALLSCST